MANDHLAKRWLEEIDPDRIQPPHVRGLLILAFGAGLDAGMKEAQDLLEEMIRCDRSGT